MSVTAGQPISAAVTNAAFVSKTALTGNDVTGKINLNNGLSGGNITNLQQTVNDKTTGPASAVDNSLPRFDSTTGKLLQGSGIVVDDSNNVSGAASLAIGGSLDPKAIIDVASTTKGALFPRMTTTQRDAITTPTTSLLIFNTTDNEFQYYDGAAWASIGGGGGIGWQETPTGTVDGVNDTFGPLTYLPSSDESVAVFVDGVAREMTTAWTIAGSTITFQAGSIPQTGQSVYVFYLTGGTPAVPVMSGTYRAEYRTLTSGEIAAKQLTLTYTPGTANYVTVGIKGGGTQFYGDDFTVSGATLDWNGLGLDGTLSTGDKLVITYVE